MRTAVGAWMLIGALGLLWLALLAPAPAVAQNRANPQADTATTDAAVYLLREAIRARRDGGHHAMLRALRHLQDPELRPLFGRLASDTHPTLQIHGILGLAEASPQRTIDLKLLAEVDRATVQAELLSSALDDGLLSEDQARQILLWPGLEDGVKIVVAGRLIHHKPFEHHALLRRALEDENLPRAAVAAVMLMQLGEADSLDVLRGIEAQAQGRARDAVYQFAIQAAQRFELDKAGPWILGVAQDEHVDLRIRLLALETTLRFKTPQAPETWRRIFTATADPDLQLRLALVALRISPWQRAAMFRVLTEHGNELIRRIGEGATAVASNRDVASKLIALVQQQHPLINAWVLQHAHDRASDEDAMEILVAVVLGYRRQANEPASAPGRLFRLEAAVIATAILAERLPDKAAPVMHQLLADPATDNEMVRAVLLGLIRSNSDRSHQPLIGIKSFADRSMGNEQLRLLLLVRGNQRLSAQEQQDLELMIRGGGGLELTLRLQAAWYYLKRTQQVPAALEEALAAR